MHRYVWLIIILATCPAAGAQPPTADQKQASAAWVAALQKADGGFAADPMSPASLPSTLHALRVFKYFGGAAKDADACAKFVKACRAGDGYAATPGGQAEVRATALGVMAQVELDKYDGKRPPSAYVTGLNYLGKHAKTFEDIRLAAATFEACHYGSPQKKAFAAEVAKLRSQNKAGTFGGGGARETATAAVALMRLAGQKLDQRDAIVKAIKDGQRGDGGWGKDMEISDLDTAYRVVRAFRMLGEKPDVARAQAFIAKCRNDDAGYGLQPGRASSLSATYYAAIVSHWLEAMK